MRRILTFAWHEAYIHLLAKTGYRFDVVERAKGGRAGWIRQFRPVPPNCRLVPEDQARVCLEAGLYDAVVAHNAADLALAAEGRAPTVLVFHNKVAVESGAAGDEERAAWMEKFRTLLAAVRDPLFVFISESKRRDWGLDGEVVLPGIDPEDYGGWHGDEARVVRVGNLLRERDAMLGYSVQERVLVGLPSIVVGLNPGIPGAFLPADWEQYKECLRRHRVFLNTTMAPYEDGYNLAMLEAMATGMPVVSLANPTSPLTDGVDGFVSADEACLRERLLELLGDREAACRMGRRGRKTVLERFPIGRFIEQWRRILGGSGRARAVPSPSGPAAVPERPRILLSYTANPVTTGAYLERALRARADVVTYGPAIDDRVIRSWNLEKIKDRVQEHDIPRVVPDLREAWRLASSPRPVDLFLWIESGVWFPLDGVRELPCPTACYLIDTHLHLERHLELARSFDVVFVAQRAYLPEFRKAGICEVHWLPLACDPVVHGGRGGAKRFAVAFVGSLGPCHPERSRLLEMLRERVPVHVERCFLEEMAGVFSASRIVFNRSVRGDLNMRVFEAMASGALLVTDEAAGSGLTDLFGDREHLAVYRSDRELVEIVEYYLACERERERVARAGAEEVLARHTYAHRAKTMMEILAPLLEARPAPSVRPAPRRGPAGALKDGGDYYRQERRDVETLVPLEASRILDVGCGAGLLGERLLRRGAVEVVGVERCAAAAEEARGRLTRVLCGDVETMDLPFSEGRFDCIVLADVLEHLRDPLGVLKRLRAFLRDGGTVVASLPNVRFLPVLAGLLEGNWTYADEGVLDRTHLRFFTRREMEKLFREADLEITGIAENVAPGWERTLAEYAGELSFGRIAVRGMTREEVKDLFVVQYLIRARKAAAGAGLPGPAAPAEAKRRALEEHLAAHPADLEALCRHAEACLDLGDEEAAKASLSVVSALDPHRPEAAVLRERIRGESGREC